MLSWKRDSNGRVVSLLIRIDEVDFNLVNIYAPTNLTDRKSFFETIHEFFFPCSSLTVSGDFNSYESASYKFGGNVSIHSEYVDLKSDFRLVEIRVLKTILYAIWKFRNKATFHNGKETSGAIVKYIFLDVRNRISCDHFRLPLADFFAIWESPVVYKTGDSFRISIR